MRGDAIVQFDWSVGEIMRTLERLGIADNTIILLTSDNGPVTDDGYVDRADELLNGHSPQVRGDRASIRLMRAERLCPSSCAGRLAA